MQKVIIFLVLILFPFSISGQQSYTVNGTTYELKTAVKGHVDLLWNVINKRYRYFMKTNDGITELLNTKDDNNDYLEEYKNQLSGIAGNTGLSTQDLKFTLQDLSQFFKAYNTASGHSAYIDDRAPLQPRLSFYGGLTNHPFINNPNNTTVPFFGAEVEVVSSNDASGHAGFFSFKHALDHDDLPYSATQLDLGYRYRFVKDPAFNIYGNLLVATYTFSKTTVALTDTTSEDVKDSSFKVPFIFGLGADIRVSDNGFVTLAYNELFGLFIESNRFPVNFALGYRFNL